MKTLFYITVFILCSCNYTENEKPATTSDPALAVIKKPAIRLYYVDSIFYKYLPDTNLVFNHPDSLRDYFYLRDDAFREFTDSLKENVADKESIVLAVKQAEILYGDLAEVCRMNYYKTWKRDNRSMGILSFFSPHSRIISLEERKSFFKTFPLEIQNNEIGRKTWKVIEGYSFANNIDFDTHQFDNLELTDTSNNKSFLKSNFNPRHKYYIMVFGASWCSPCRLEEMQIKYWFPYIDTIQIKIIGLSVDNKPQRWKKYLSEEKLPWPCYLLKNGFNNSLSKKLEIQSIPRNFLLDSTGKIIAENTDIRKILKAIPILETGD